MSKGNKSLRWDTAGAWELVLAEARAALERASSTPEPEAETLPADRGMLERILIWMVSMRDATYAAATGDGDALSAATATDTPS